VGSGSTLSENDHAACRTLKNHYLTPSILLQRRVLFRGSKDKKMKKRTGWIIVGLVAIAAVAWGPMVSNVEQAKYAVVESQGDIQIRDYAHDCCRSRSFRCAQRSD
jgi:hypothetical protein